MSKKHMKFLFLISGILQLSQAQELLPKIYGTFYVFEDERLLSSDQLDERSMTTVFSETLVPGEYGANNVQQNIYNVSITNDGTCYLTFYLTFLHTLLSSLLISGRLEATHVHGVGICQLDQAIIRWHIKSEQTVDGIHSYDFVFVRDPEQVITEENLNQLSRTPMIGNKLI